MNFWSQFQQAECYPDKCQCELARDELIRQPSSFWSSLAYIVAAWAIYRHVREKSVELKLWTGVCVLMGLSSLAGHGTYIRVALAFDFASIVLVMSFFALLNVFLLLKQSLHRILIYFSIYYTGLFFAMYGMSKFAKIGMCLLVFAFAMTDVFREMGPKFFKARSLQISLGVLMIAFGFFVLDENHIGCDPTSLFQFHSLWHFGTAMAIYYYGKWRFEEMRAR